LRRASAFLLPSHAEGLPMGLLEAMAHGLPVITTPVGGIPEVVKDRDTGLLVAPGDVGGLARAIACIARDTALREDMGRRGRVVVTKRFSATTTIGLLVDLWQSVHRNRPVQRNRPKPSPGRRT
jgi:glycosyltransferase involved in cell wall biosynthesis